MSTESSQHSTRSPVNPPVVEDASVDASLMEPGAQPGAGSVPPSIQAPTVMFEGLESNRSSPWEPAEEIAMQARQIDSELDQLRADLERNTQASESMSEDELESYLELEDGTPNPAPEEGRQPTSSEHRHMSRLRMMRRNLRGVLEDPSGGPTPLPRELPSVAQPPPSVELLEPVPRAVSDPSQIAAALSSHRPRAVESPGVGVVAGVPPGDQGIDVDGVADPPNGSHGSSGEHWLAGSAQPETNTRGAHRTTVNLRTGEVLPSYLKPDLSPSAHARRSAYPEWLQMCGDGADDDDVDGDVGWIPVKPKKGPKDHLWQGSTYYDPITGNVGYYDPKDPPPMAFGYGGTPLKVPKLGHHVSSRVYRVGGKPKSDWSGAELDPAFAGHATIRPHDESKLAKTLQYLLKPHEPGFKKGDKLPYIFKNLWPEFLRTGLDTHCYVRDPNNPDIVLNLLKHPYKAGVSQKWIRQEMEWIKSRWDGSGYQENRLARELLVRSLHPSVRSTLVTESRLTYTFQELWMALVLDEGMTTLARTLHVSEFVTGFTIFKVPHWNVSQAVEMLKPKIEQLQQVGEWNPRDLEGFLKSLQHCIDEKHSRYQGWWPVIASWVNDVTDEVQKQKLLQNVPLYEMNDHLATLEPPLDYNTILTNVSEMYSSLRHSGEWPATSNPVDSKVPGRRYKASVNLAPVEGVGSGGTSADVATLRAQVNVLTQQLDSLSKSKTQPRGTGSGSAPKGGTRTSDGVLLDRNGNPIKCWDCGGNHYAAECPQKSGMTKGGSHTKSQTRGSNGNRTKGGNRGNSKSYEWKNVAPKPGQPQTMTKDGKKYMWCAKCKAGKGLWTLSHSTSQHVDDYNGKNTGDASANLVSSCTDPCAWYCPTSLSPFTLLWELLVLLLDVCWSLAPLMFCLCLVWVLCDHYLSPVPLSASGRTLMDLLWDYPYQWWYLVNLCGLQPSTQLWVRGTVTPWHTLTSPAFIQMMLFPCLWLTLPLLVWACLVPRGGHPWETAQTPTPPASRRHRRWVARQVNRAYRPRHKGASIWDHGYNRRYPLHLRSQCLFPQNPPSLSQQQSPSYLPTYLQSGWSYVRGLIPQCCGKGETCDQGDSYKAAFDHAFGSCKFFDCLWCQQEWPPGRTRGSWRPTMDYANWNGPPEAQSNDTGLNGDPRRSREPGGAPMRPWTARGAATKPDGLNSDLRRSREHGPAPRRPWTAGGAARRPCTDPGAPGTHKSDRCRVYIPKKVFSNRGRVTI